MTKKQSLYQVKLILDYMPDDEYNKIPQDTINYILQNMEEDSNIIIDPEISLENQNIDEKTYDFLEKIVKQIENSNINEPQEINKKNEIDELTRDDLINLLEKYKQENSKVGKAKDLIVEYKNTLDKKNQEIDELKQINQDLYSSIQKCPKIIKKLFFRKMEQKLLK